MLTGPHLVLADFNPILISWADYAQLIDSSQTNIRAATADFWHARMALWQPLPPFYISQNPDNSQVLPPVDEGRFCAKNC